jgi:restriction system protein
MIPEFQTLMLPLLAYISDRQIHNIHDTIDALAKKLNLTEEDLNEWLPSKSQKKFYNYVYWAKAHLKMAGAIENKGRGKFQITDRGIEILRDNPSAINIRYLADKYDDYKKIVRGEKKKGDFEIKNSSSIGPGTDYTELTPEEEIEMAHQKISSSLKQEILSKLKSVHPSFFERIVVQLLVKM